MKIQLYFTISQTVSSPSLKDIPEPNVNYAVIPIDSSNCFPGCIDGQLLYYGELLYYTFHGFIVHVQNM